MGKSRPRSISISANQIGEFDQEKNKFYYIASS